MRRLPPEFESLIAEALAASRLAGVRRRRLERDLREHLEEALDEHTPQHVRRSFGDPGLTGRLAALAPPPLAPPTRLMRHVIAAAAALMLGIYASSAYRLETFSPNQSAFSATLDSIAHAGAPALPTPELRRWFETTVRASRMDTIVGALRLAQAMKSVRRPSARARLAEPLLFLRVRSIADVWPAALEASRRRPRTEIPLSRVAANSDHP